MARARIRAVVLGLLLATTTGCLDEQCMGNACLADDESSSTSDENVDCDELETDATAPTVGMVPSDASWGWRHCYRFALRENAWLKLTSNTTERTVPNFKVYADTGEDVFPASDPGLVNAAGGEISRPLPKGSYALVLTSALPGKYEFNLAAEYQESPSPESDPADFPSDRNELMELKPTPTAEVHDYIGEPDQADYFSVTFDAPTEIVLTFGETKIVDGFSTVKAELFADKGDGTATEVDKLAEVNVQPGFEWPPAQGEVPAGPYLIKVSGIPALYTLMLSAKPVE